MFGMDTMANSVTPFAQSPEVSRVLLMFSNPVLGMLAGLILTAIIQSSSASVGILQALCASGAVSYATAIPIIMGANVGACMPALLSGAGGNKGAKRAALIHLYYNIITTVTFLIVFYAIDAFVHFEVLGQAASAVGVAIIHSMFNVAAVIVLSLIHI